MVNTGTAFRLVILLFVAGVVLGACVKRQTSASSRARQQGNQASVTSGSAQKSPAALPAGGAPSGAGTVHLKPVNSATAGALRPAPENQPGSIGASVPLEGTDRLLAMRGGTAIYPLDYEIGSLQPSAPGGTAQGQVIRIIQSFFGSLEAGKPDEALLSPTWKDDIIRLLRYPLDKGDVPTSVRIGILRIEQDKAHAAIRMEKGQGSATGEVYLERVNGTWYISDIQADFSKLAHPLKRNTQFDPAEWKAMMKE